MFDVAVGYILELFGRRNTIFAGFIISSLFVALTPFFKTIYPGIFFARLVTILGLSASLSSPFVADYIKKRTRGTASAIVRKAIYRLRME